MTMETNWRIDGVNVVGQRVLGSASWLGDVAPFVGTSVRAPYEVSDIGAPGGQFATKRDNRQFVGTQAQVAAWIRQDVQQHGILAVGISPNRSGPKVSINPYTGSVMGDVAGAAAADPGFARVLATRGLTLPPMPHPDASNQTIGPNLGGTDGVVMPGDLNAGSTAPSAGFGAGALLLVGGVVLLLLMSRR